MTMGLLLCRQLAEASKGPDPSHCDPFFESCILLLSSSLGSRGPAKGPGPIRIRPTVQYEAVWMPIKEYWFISVNSLAHCISQYPQISKLILEDGWLGDLLKMLKQVKADYVDAEQKVAYRVLLSACAEYNPDCKQFLKKNNALHLAKKYGFESLVSLLSS